MPDKPNPPIQPDPNNPSPFPVPPGPTPAAVERKGKYAFVPPSRTCDWWEISDMERMYAVVTIQAGAPGAEAIARYAWRMIDGKE
jgi:hypothetical protein